MLLSLSIEIPSTVLQILKQYNFDVFLEENTQIIHPLLGRPTEGPVFCWASEDPKEAKGDIIQVKACNESRTTKMQNCHFYIFQEPNSFEGPPSHIQFIDMPVDSSYMDGVGIFS